MTAREKAGVKVILPVWHNITREQVQEFSPILAGRFAARSEQGLERVIKDLLAVEGLALPTEQDEAKGQLAPPRPGVRRYRVKRDFDEIDRADFREAAFDVIRDYFECTVAEIDTIEDLRGRFVSLSAASFTCTIVNRAREHGTAHITVHGRRENVGLDLGDISYSFAENAPSNKANGVFTIEADEYELYLSPLMMGLGGHPERMTPAAAAEHLWEDFLQQVGVTSD